MKEVYIAGKRVNLTEHQLEWCVNSGVLIQDAAAAQHYTIHEHYHRAFMEAFRDAFQRHVGTICLPFIPPPVQNVAVRLPASGDVLQINADDVRHLTAKGCTVYVLLRDGIGFCLHLSSAADAVATRDFLCDKLSLNPATLPLEAIDAPDERR